MNLLKSPTGHVTNISAQAPIFKIQDTKPPEPEPRPEPEPEPDSLVPPKPIFFHTHDLFSGDDGYIELGWSYPIGYDGFGLDIFDKYPLHKSTHIYRHTEKDFSSAIKIGITEKDEYLDRNLQVGRYWYWIQWESQDGVTGPLSNGDYRLKSQSPGSVVLLDFLNCDGAHDSSRQIVRGCSVDPHVFLKLSLGRLIARGAEPHGGEWGLTGIELAVGHTDDLLGDSAI